MSLADVLACRYCANDEHVYNLGCNTCRVRMVKRASDVKQMQHDRREQALDVIRRTQGAGAVLQTAKDLATK